MDTKSNDNNLTVNKINDKFFWDICSRPVNITGCYKTPIYPISTLKN